MQSMQSSYFRRAAIAATVAVVAVATAAPGADADKVPGIASVERQVEKKLPSLGSYYRYSSWVRACSRSGPRRWDCEVGSSIDSIDGTYVVARYSGGRIYVRRASH